jgi:hypothetical protein
MSSRTASQVPEGETGVSASGKVYSGFHIFLIAVCFDQARAVNDAQLKCKTNPGWRQVIVFYLREKDKR